MINNIFANNTCAPGPPFPPNTGNSVAFTAEHGGGGSITYCDAYPDQGSTPANEAYHYYDESGVVTPGVGCVYVNPSFCDGTYTNEYCLQPDSLLRTTYHGLNPAQGNGVPAEDKDARPRPGSDNVTDMGAYEDNPSCQ